MYESNYAVPSCGLQNILALRHLCRWSHHDQGHPVVELRRAVVSLPDWSLVIRLESTRELNASSGLHTGSANSYILDL